MIRLAFCSCLLAAIYSSPLPATEAVDPLAGLRNCAAQTDDARRLVCYDAAMRGSKSPAPAAAASPAAAAAVAVTPTTEDSFGYRGNLAREHLDAQEDKTPKLKQLAAQVTAVSTQPHGEFIITLDNGQVWAQKGPELNVKLKVSDSVTIKAGSLGSFMLVAPTGRSTRVARVR